MNLIETYSKAPAVAFDKNAKIQKTKAEYKDPLMKWPLRGCAYSNEVGAAISSLAPKLGAALWVPALMYFGADIYDKYKNFETERGS